MCKEEDGNTVCKRVDKVGFVPAEVPVRYRS